MAETVGYAALQVVPVLAGLQGNLQQMMRPLLQQSQQIGVTVGNNIAQGAQNAEGKVRQASQRMQAARAAEADAAGRARIAEAQLNEVRARGDAATSDLIQAEERLRIAQREAADATKQRERAVDQLSRAQADLANSTDDVADSTDEAEQSTSRFRDSIGGLGGHLSDGAKKLGAFAVAAAGIGGAMDLAAGAIENQQITNKLAAQMGATGDLAAEYGQKAGDLYRNGFGESMQDAADAIGIVASSFTTAGFEGERSMEAIAEDAMNFATIFDQDVAGSVQAASQLVVNGLAKDSTEAFDLMTTAFQRVPVAMRDELPELMNEYGTFLSSMGFNGQEAFGLLVNASEQGAIAMDKVGDALKETGIRATDLGDTGAVEALEAIGLGGADIQNRLLQGGDAARDAFKQMTQALVDVKDPAAQAAAATALFGTPLEDLNKAEIPAFLEAMNSAGDSMAGFEGAAAEAGGTLNSGLGVALETLKRKAIGGLTDAMGLAAKGVLTAASGIGTALSPAIDTVKLFIGAFTGAGSDVELPWMNTVIDLASRARAVFDEVRGGFTAFVAAFKDGGNDVTSSGFAGFLEQLGLWFRMAWDTGSQFVSLLQGTLAPVVTTLGSVAMPVLGAAFDVLIAAISKVVEIGTNIINFFIEHKDITAAVAATITAFMLPALVTMGASLAVQAAQWTVATAQMVIYNTVGKAIAAATKAWAAAQWVLNAAMSANPIGLIIAGVVALGAGLVLAWKNSETFRNIVMGAWEGIKNVVSGAWSNVLKPTIDWIVGAFGWIGEKASWLWTSVIQPTFAFIGDAARVLMGVLGAVLITPFILAWNAIGATVQFVWNTFLSPIWETMKAGLGLLGQAFSWVWNSVIKPAWDALGAGIAWVYNSIINPTWEALKAALAAVGGFFQATWNNVIKPAWDALGAGIQWVWNSIINPTWEALKTALSAVGTFFQNTWNNVIKPAWDALGSGIKWVWDNVVNPVWEAMKGALDTLKSSFDTAVGFIGQVWDRIKSIVAKPVRFVVETVYNNGIRAAWNKVAGFLGLDELQPVDLGLLGAYASGGVIPGYTPGRDTGLIAVGGGEAVMRPEWTRAMGPDYVDGANAAARMGGVQGVKKFMGAYANGGIVESIVGLVNQHFPGMTITSTYRNTNDHHGAGKAVDFSDGTDSTPGMKAAAQWFYENYGGSLLELIHSPFGNNVKDGANVGDGFGFYGADTMAAHRNHVHVAAPFALDPSIAGQMDPSIWDRIKSAASSAVESLRSVVARLFDGVMDPIGEMIPSFGDSPIGRLPKLAFDKFRTSVRDWILGQADQRGGSSGGSFDVAPGTGPVADQVREAFAAYGWGEGAQWDAANWIIGKESSWNPTARNPDSGAFGLFQFLGGTKDQYLPDENPNPKIQGDAGARYIRDRYGDPLAAKAFWEQNGWYDQGGLASGVGVMLKNVIQPERVLSPEMTKHFERLVDVLEKPEFIDALKQAAPAAADSTAASTGAAQSAPVGGTGVGDTYTSTDDKWAEWNKNAQERFANAGTAFLEGQLEGMPFGNHLRGMRDRGSEINIIVQDMFEAVEKLRQEERRKTVASGSRF